MEERQKFNENTEINLNNSQQVNINANNFQNQDKQETQNATTHKNLENQEYKQNENANTHKNLDFLNDNQKENATTYTNFKNPENKQNGNFHTAYKMHTNQQQNQAEQELNLDAKNNPKNQENNNLNKTDNSQKLDAKPQNIDSNTQNFAINQQNKAILTQNDKINNIEFTQKYSANSMSNSYYSAENRDFQNLNSQPENAETEIKPKTLNKRQKTCVQIGAIFHIIATTLLTLCLIAGIVVLFSALGSINKLGSINNTNNLAVSSGVNYSANLDNLEYINYAEASDFPTNYTVSLFDEDSGTVYTEFGRVVDINANTNIVFIYSQEYSISLALKIDPYIQFIGVDNITRDIYIPEYETQHLFPFTTQLMEQYQIIVNVNYTTLTVIDYTAHTLILEDDTTNKTYTLPINSADYLTDIIDHGIYIGLYVDEDNFNEYNNITSGGSSDTPSLTGTEEITNASPGDFYPNYDIKVKVSNDSSLTIGTVLSSNDSIFFMENGDSVELVYFNNSIDITVNHDEQTITLSLFSATNMTRATLQDLFTEKTISVFAFENEYSVVEIYADAFSINHPDANGGDGMVQFNADFIDNAVIGDTYCELYLNEDVFLSYNGFDTGSGFQFPIEVLLIIAVLAFAILNFIIAGSLLKIKKSKKDKKFTGKRITGIVFSTLSAVLFMALSIVAFIQGLGSIVIIVFGAVAMLVAILLLVSLVMYSISFSKLEKKIKQEPLYKLDEGLAKIRIINRLKQEGIFSELEAKDLIYKQILSDK